MDPVSTESHVSLLLKGWAWWVVIPLALGAAWLAVKMARPETVHLGKGGLWLRAMRATVALLLVLFIGQPVLQTLFPKYQEPRMVLLVDRSASMEVRDTQEALEWKVRAAIAVGLLDEKLRDTNAEQAAALLRQAQERAETAAAALRLAQQAARESVANVSVSRLRIKDVCAALKQTRQLSDKALARIRALAAAPQELALGIEKAVKEAASLAKEIDETPLDTTGAGDRLQDKLRLITAHHKGLTQLFTLAVKTQDLVDRTLGEKNDPAIREALVKLNGMSRMAITEQLLTRQIKPFVNERKVLVKAYYLDTDLQPAPHLQAALTESLPKAEGAAQQKPATKKETAARENVAETDLATPLFRLTEREGQENVAAVVLCSDGRHTTGPLPEDAARALAARGVKLHTLGVGAVKAPADICVARLEGPLSVFKDETIRLTTHLRGVGYKDREVKLVLKRGQEVLQERGIKFISEEWRQEVFEVPASQSGANLFIVSIEPLDGEALVPNNIAEALVDVASDKLRVLVIDEEPRWETRYIASLLRRERKMVLDERWLRYGQDFDKSTPALPQEPGKLDEYDMVVIGDIPAERLGDADQKRLASYVSDRGGFLVVLAGQLAMPQKYLTGPVAELLPIRPVGSIAEGTGLPSVQAVQQGVRVKLADPAHAPEIVQILRDPSLNEQLWPLLPELKFVYRPSFAKPGATPLLITNDVRQDVVVASQFFGLGRVLYLGTDETWRWRHKVGDRVHAYFWSQAIRWGVSQRLTGDKRLKVGVDRRRIRPGENVEVLARPADAKGLPVSNAIVVAEVEFKAGRQRVQLQPVPDSRGLYRGEIQNLPSGLHNVVVHVEGLGFQDVKAEVQVMAREATGQEGVELTRDADRLNSMAQAGDGVCMDLLQAGELLKTISAEGKYLEREESFELWSSYPALLLIIGLLSAEWLLRKRYGLA
jgi:hypothetical protein